MNKKFEKYLDTIYMYLRPLPISERTDIIKEIEASIVEMERENLSTEKILDRLGNPQELAKAYLGDLLMKENRFSWSRFLTICAFYSTVGFSGMIVIPCLVIMAPAFIICGITSVFVMIIKIIDDIFNLGLPYMENFGVFVGIVELNPIIQFIIGIIIGVLLFILGLGCWKLLLCYCKKVSKTKSNLLL